MSANLDLVRSIYAAWARGDFRRVEWAHPDIEFVMVDGPSLGRWKGLADMAKAWRDFLGAWEDYRTQGEEYRELGERVFVLAHFSARGKTSGVGIGWTWTKGATLFHISGGKVTRLVSYHDRERALADLGVASEGGAADTAD
jgi:ketosteroid isomerase-like protein